jgi:hypothetical protein
MPTAPARASQSPHSRPPVQSGRLRTRISTRITPTMPTSATSAESATGTAGTRWCAVTTASSTPEAATRASRTSIAENDSQPVAVDEPTCGP